MAGARMLRVVVAVGLTISWMAIAIVGLGWAALIDFLGDTYCERGDSNYGELSWSRLPPGPVCSWTEQRNGFTETYGPTPVMAIWLLALLVLGFIALRFIRRISAPASRLAGDTMPATQRESS